MAQNPTETKSKENADIPKALRKKIIRLWKSPSFAGSYLGLSNFRLALKLDENIEISREELRKIMNTDEDFLLETRKIRKKIDRRKINVHGYCAT